MLFLTMHIVPKTFKPFGFKIERVLKKPATKAAPHLSLCIPDMWPPAFTSAPPVSYVIPLPTKKIVVSTVESVGVYSSLITFPACLGVANKIKK